MLGLVALRPGDAWEDGLAAEPVPVMACSALRKDPCPLGRLCSLLPHCQTLLALANGWSPVCFFPQCFLGPDGRRNIDIENWNRDPLF